MLVTARAEYACLAMLELASRWVQRKPVRLIEVTEKHGIPQRFLVQIMLQMKNAGLVITTRGSAGGYQLAKSPELITIADIFAALSRMDDGEDRELTETPMSIALQKVWKGLTESHHRFLQKYTLQELLPKQDEPDYVI